MCFWHFVFFAFVFVFVFAFYSSVWRVWVFYRKRVFLFLFFCVFFLGVLHFCVKGLSLQKEYSLGHFLAFLAFYSSVWRVWGCRKSTLWDIFYRKNKKKTFGGGTRGVRKKLQRQILSKNLGGTFFGWYANKKKCVLVRFFFWCVLVRGRGWYVCAGM